MRGKPCGAWLSGRFRARMRPLAFDRTRDGYPSVTRITHCYAFIAVHPVFAGRYPGGDATHRIVMPGLRIGEATPTSWCRTHAEAWGRTDGPVNDGEEACRGSVRANRVRPPAAGHGPNYSRRRPSTGRTTAAGGRPRAELQPPAAVHGPKHSRRRPSTGRTTAAGGRPRAELQPPAAVHRPKLQPAGGRSGCLTDSCWYGAADRNPLRPVP